MNYTCIVNKYIFNNIVLIIVWYTLQQLMVCVVCCLHCPCTGSVCIYVLCIILFALCLYLYFMFVLASYLYQFNTQVVPPSRCIIPHNIQWPAATCISSCLVLHFNFIVPAHCTVIYVFGPFLHVSVRIRFFSNSRINYHSH